MSIKDMDFQGHPAAHFAVVLHQNINKFNIIFGLVIAQEDLNHCDKAVPSFFLFLLRNTANVNPFTLEERIVTSTWEHERKNTGDSTQIHWIHNIYGWVGTYRPPYRIKTDC
ncbi:uncharacterized protein LOC143236043 [Tachypleus tridentatus]|uniref:uncharacterized protein LOC143236043 n=1 Tax=Tachypleus tridentatus TaxID=6853 RepID=UPI003FD52F12